MLPTETQHKLTGCIAFGGLRVGDAVENALLAVVQPGAVKAAVEAEAQATHRRDQARDAMFRDLEAARYAAGRAFRQYDAADPENRLVAGELETRWNHALARVGEIETRIAGHDATAAQLYKSGFDPTVNVRLRHSFNGGIIGEVDSMLSRMHSTGCAGASDPRALTRGRVLDNIDPLAKLAAKR